MESAPPRRWPPGFRFSPTDEELVLYFLKRRIASGRPTPYVADVDVYRSHPSHLPERSALQTGDRQWFFFSRLDRKYPNGSRASRTTADGYWKATGKDRLVSGGRGGRAVGNKKTLVYHHGRAPHGERTDWVMHEYTILPDALPPAAIGRDTYALYKLFQKSGAGPKNGEQYGAPFREEDWLSDEEGVASADAAAHPVPTATNSTATLDKDTGRELPISDLDEFLSQIEKDQEQVEAELDFSTLASPQSHLQHGHGQGWLGDSVGEKAEVVNASTSSDADLAQENTCTDLPLGDLEGLLMQISDDQQNAELLSDFTTLVPELQLQCDDHQVWLDADRGEGVGAEDPNASSDAVVTAECTGTEHPLDDLEGLLQQIANDQEMVESLSDPSTPFPRHNFYQVGMGDFHESHGAPVGNPSCIVQESTDLDLRTEPSQIPQSNLTNIPLSGEINCAEETSAPRSVSDLISYNSQDADDEFLEINDFFDLEDVDQSMNCTATQHLVYATNGMFDSLEYSDALPGPFDITGVVAENQFIEFVDSGIQNQGYQYTTEVRTHNQVALNVQNHVKHSHVILPSTSSGTVNLHTLNEPSSQIPSSSPSWFNAALSALLDSVPSSPAMAAENAVINRTLQRISSFRSQQAASEKPSAPVIPNRSGRLIFVSLLVLLAAILWTSAAGSALPFCKRLWKSSST
ncbi:hypothetical protein ACP70R_006142 [Stipagrostis hirtigluma subsp. patula]